MTSLRKGNNKIRRVLYFVSFEKKILHSTLQVVDYYYSVDGKKCLNCFSKWTFLFSSDEIISSQLAVFSVRFFVGET